MTGNFSPIQSNQLLPVKSKCLVSLDLANYQINPKWFSKCSDNFVFLQYVDHVTIYQNFQVMFKVRQAKATPPPPPRRIHIRRTSSRRSGYAFSHAQGYGDLVTSGRFLRRPAVYRSSGFTHVGRTTTGFSPMGRSAGYSPTGRPQNVKAPDVEVTSLQMYRTIRDPAL